LSFVKDNNYGLSFDVWSTDTNIVLKFGVADESNTAKIIDIFSINDFSITSTLNDKPTKFATNFVAKNSSAKAKFRFLLGPTIIPVGQTVCIDNIQLIDPTQSSAIELEQSFISVNQTGYIPNLPKTATYKMVLSDEIDKTNSRLWNLKNSSAKVVASGLTQLIGLDKNSGDYIHHIDFSEFSKSGNGYTLEVIESGKSILSEPFDIQNDLLDNMQFEALEYFYHNRSGTKILESVVGIDEFSNNTYARDAGNSGDVAVNTWACKVDQTSSGDKIDTSLAGCRIDVDVSGGWYDAGDHGKYIVNGGVSVWTLLNQFERANLQNDNDKTFSTDSAMALPKKEKKNDLPDLLDEVKWELDFFMKMQIPAGELQAGMVYHKIHDLGWTGIPQLPSTDPKTRYIHPATTAATLNFAAVMAQCSRVYEQFDDVYAAKCLKLAKVAYGAAKTNPTQLAGLPGSNTAVNSNVGGGLYNDKHVEDEFYWAANELYLSTNLENYKNDIKQSPLHKRFVAKHQQNEATPSTIFSWQQTHTLGLLSMATAGKQYSADNKLINNAKQMLTLAADTFSWYANNPGYSVALNTEKNIWGSNSSVVNNMLVLGIVNDFTDSKESCYIDAMANSMSYLLGNNPMNISYVTGYGEKTVQQPHHRFWANAVSANSPRVPAGVLSGGPNMGLEDDIAKYQLSGCASEKCYLDDIEAWSVNEITINWNAPLAWVSAYLASEAANAGSSCRINYANTKLPELITKTSK
ncbi:MAG: glycoside hydrolase family 9 protein, partial [Pseudomonadales bacterium]|nr:glycoside hydrolase family 9 protein [Pseudomonadales bacterium]